MRIVWHCDVRIGDTAAQQNAVPDMYFKNKNNITENWTMPINMAFFMSVYLHSNFLKHILFHMVEGLVVFMEEI